MNRSTIFMGNKLVTIVGEVLYADKKIVAKSDAKNIGKSLEILVI